MMLSQNLHALRTRAEKLRADLAAAGSNPLPVPETNGTFAQKTATLNAYLHTLESLRGGVIAPVLSPAPGTLKPDAFPQNLRAPLEKIPLTSATSGIFKPDAFPSNMRAPLERRPLAEQPSRPVGGSPTAGKPQQKPDAPNEHAAATWNVALLDAYDALVTEADRRAFGRVHGNELRGCSMHNSLITHILAAHELGGRCRVLVSQERAKADAAKR